MEHQGGAQFLGEVVDQLIEEGGEVFPGGVGEVAGAGGGLGFALTAREVSADGVAGAAGGSAMQPSGGGSGDGGSFAGHLHEAVLGDVFGVVGVSRDAAGDGEDEGGVTAYQLGEGVGV